jgi:hypothetical protein
MLRNLVLVLSLLMLNAFCARSVGPAPPDPTPACFGPDGEVNVRAFQNPRFPTASPVRRVSWNFRVGCDPSTQVYTFGVRQNADNRLELDPALPAGAPPLIFNPSPDPFQFRIGGPVHGYWCAIATVELMNGDLLRTDEFFVNEYRSQPAEIAMIASHQRGVDRVDAWAPDTGLCPLR